MNKQERQEYEKQSRKLGDAMREHARHCDPKRATARDCANYQGGGCMIVHCGITKFAFVGDSSVRCPAKCDAFNPTVLP